MGEPSVPLNSAHFEFLSNRAMSEPRLYPHDVPKYQEGTMANDRGLLPKARREDLPEELRRRLDRWYRDAYEDDNLFLAMARRPGLLDATMGFVRYAYGATSSIEPELFEIVRVRLAWKKPLRPLKPRAFLLGRAPRRDGRAGGQGCGLRAYRPPRAHQGRPPVRGPAHVGRMADRPVVLRRPPARSHRRRAARSRYGGDVLQRLAAPDRRVRRRPRPL